MCLFLFFVMKLSRFSIFLDLVFNVLHIIDISSRNRIKVHIVFNLFFSIVIVKNCFISLVFVISCISFEIHLLCPLSSFNFTWFNLFFHIDFFYSLIKLWLPLFALFFRVTWTIICMLSCNLWTFTFRFYPVLRTLLIDSILIKYFSNHIFYYDFLLFKLTIDSITKGSRNNWHYTFSILPFLLGPLFSINAVIFFI